MSGNGKTPGLTPERRETIVRSIGAGVPITTACSIAGVHATTFYRWMRGTRPVEREFQKAVEAAQASVESDLVSAMTKSALRDGSWRAAAWLLERRDPANWGTLRDRKIAEAEANEAENPLLAFDKVADELAAKRKKKGGR